MAIKQVSVIDRILRRIQVTTSDCWEWQGYINRARGGYGMIGVGSTKDGTKRTAYVHCVAYEHYVGPIPEGMEIDHRCHNKICVNPAHMAVATHAENMQRIPLTVLQMGHRKSPPRREYGTTECACGCSGIVILNKHTGNFKYQQKYGTKRYLPYHHLKNIRHGIEGRWRKA
jgi:hypothetical protein